MATNKFVTLQNIARQTLPILVSNLLFPNMVHQDYSKDFVGQGDTIQVRRPPVYTANDFTGAISIQDTNQGKVNVTMDKLADVSVEITSKDLALNAADFKRIVSEPMAVALAEKINREGLELAVDIPYFSGTPGTTPDALEDFSAIREGLNLKKAPVSMRRACWNVAADAKFTQLDALVKVNESGAKAALREGEIGRVFGMDNYMSQSVYVHTAGAATATVDPAVNGALAVGDTTMAIDAAAMTGGLKKGDVFSFTGYEGTYVVLADTAVAAGNAIAAVSFYPALTEIIADNTVVVFAEKAAGGSVRNLGFNKNAFAFVTRSLPMPSTGQAYVTSYNGITLRVVQDYSITAKKEILSMDVLYGYKTMYPELAHVRLG